MADRMAVQKTLRVLPDKHLQETKHLAMEPSSFLHTVIKPDEINNSNLWKQRLIRLTEPALFIQKQFVVNLSLLLIKVC